MPCATAPRILAVHRGGVDDRATVLGHDVADHAGRPGQPVHLDEGDVGGAGDRHPGRIVGRVDLEAGLDLRGEGLKR